MWRHNNVTFTDIAVFWHAMVAVDMVLWWFLHVYWKGFHQGDAVSVIDLLTVAQYATRAN